MLFGFGRNDAYVVRSGEVRSGFVLSGKVLNICSQVIQLVRELCLRYGKIWYCLVRSG